MNPHSTHGVSGLNASSKEATAAGSNNEPRNATTLLAPEPTSPKQPPITTKDQDNKVKHGQPAEQ